MSTTAPLAERTTTAVLLALWNTPETTLQNLLAQTLASLPDVQQSLQLLRDRQCLIEQTPTSLRLVSVGLPCWQDILQHLACSRRLHIARRVMVFTRTASTNDIAWQAAKNPDHHGLLVLADEQSAGRGRLGRSWSAKAGQSILLSLLLQNSHPGTLDQLTLLAGLATARALESAALNIAHQVLPLHIKWPNDILLQNKKLAGILVEHKAGHTVLGIGINVAQSASDFPAELAPHATSLYLATGVHIDRLRILAALLIELDTLTQSLGGDPAAWLPDWKSRCSMLHTQITARSNHQLVTGLVTDIDPLHGLVLRTPSGATTFLSAQTTSLNP